MEETNDGCRIFERKNLEIQPIGRQRIIFDDKKIRIFQEASCAKGYYKKFTQERIN